MFFQIVSEYKSGGYLFERKINWNIQHLAGSKNANGLILQHIRHVATPLLDFYPNEDYYEAWEVAEGVCISTEDEDHDDVWALGFNYIDDINRSLGTRGHIDFYAEVFWIADNTRLYSLTKQELSSLVVENAGGLLSAYSISFGNQLLNAHVHSFYHAWDLTSEEKVLAHLSRDLAYAYRQDTLDEKRRLKAAISDILSETSYAQLAEELMKHTLRKIELSNNNVSV